MRNVERAYLLFRGLGKGRIPIIPQISEYERMGL